MRPAVIVLALSFAAIGGLVYMKATRESADTAPAATAAAPLPQQTGAASRASPLAAVASSNTTVPASASNPPASDADDAAAAAKAARPDTLEQWIKDTQDRDPKIRAAAIAKLGSAPKAQALPALKSVLETGEPEVDRHIALNSLHTLALRDGDKNGQVRDVMRSAIYHSDNDGVMQTAQSLLDDVEAALAEQQAK